ncbi:MAG: thiol:disulfide interchange protein DsbG [Lysobacterales bacterium 14-68-21]|jgi:thiol:disulfide interchange protein DsbG|nr:MAG: thiol:disulfide interchange protein DsbG [Xanthomonadales bacterium 15-68-25]OZB65621.1 MAG: thiol:disulfide interchange protein DsbG [Xanthomonadales bacterium 14-68-21]
MKFRLLGLALLLSACAQAQDTPNYPAPVQALEAKGMTIKGPLPAPDGYHAYLGSYGGRPVPVYVPPDGKHAFVGVLFDEQGKDLTQGPMSDATKPVLDAATWASLEKSTWIAEGSPKASRIVYVFNDTECPYCHRLWAAIQPKLAKGEVQVRYVMVAVIAPKSESRAAAVLEAADPAATLRQHEQHFGNSPVQPVAKVSAATAKKLEDNATLMDTLGITGTPAVIYKDASGKIRQDDGMPPPDALDEIFGK